MNQKRDAIVALAAEMKRGREKFPGNKFMLAGLVEEVGELAKAILDRDPDAIFTEAVQCAGVALRIAEEGDATEYAELGFAGFVQAVGNVARFLLQRKAIGRLRALELAMNHARVIRFDEDPTFDDVTDEQAQP